MSIDISRLPEYNDAYSRFMVARKAAQDSANETELAKAEKEWAEARAALTEKAYVQRDQQQAVERAMSEAAAQFPHAPKEAYAHLSDPDQILAVAKSVHDGVAAKLPPSGGDQQQPGGGSGWTPPTGGPPTTAQPTGQTHEQRLAELAPRARLGLRGEAENAAYRKAVFDEKIADRFDFLKGQQ